MGLHLYENVIKLSDIVKMLVTFVLKFYMNELDLHNRVLSVLSKTLKIKSETIKKRNWDSLEHISLISAMEEEFDIIFEPEEIVEMIHYENIIIIIQQKTGINISL